MEPENNQQPNIDNEPVAGNPRDEGQQNPAPVVIAFDDVDDATEEEFFESWKFFMYDHEKKWHTERAIQRARNQAAAASASSAPLPSFDSTQHINQSIEDPVDERTLQGPSQAVEQHPVPGPSNSTKQPDSQPASIEPLTETLKRSEENENKNEPLVAGNSHSPKQLSDQVAGVHQTEVQSGEGPRQDVVEAIPLISNSDKCGCSEYTTAVLETSAPLIPTENCTHTLTPAAEHGPSVDCRPLYDSEQLSDQVVGVHQNEFQSGESSRQDGVEENGLIWNSDNSSTSQNPETNRISSSSLRMWEAVNALSNRAQSNSQPAFKVESCRKKLKREPWRSPRSGDSDSDSETVSLEERLRQFKARMNRKQRKQQNADGSVSKKLKAAGSTDNNAQDGSPDVQPISRSPIDQSSTTQCLQGSSKATSEPSLIEPLENATRSSHSSNQPNSLPTNTSYLLPGPSNAAKQATVQPDRVEPFVKAPTTSQDFSKTNSVPTASVPGPSTAAEQPNSRPARVPSATTPRISQGPNNFYMWPSARSAKETVAALYGLKNRSQVTGSSSRLSQSEATSIPSRSSQSGSRTSIQPVVQVAVAALHQNIDSLRGSDTDSSGETSPPPNSRLTTRPNLGPRPSSSTQPSSQPSSVVPPAMTLRRSQESNQNSNQPTARVSAARANSGPGPSNEVDAVRSSIEKADFRLITNPHSNPTSSVQDDPTEMIVVTREVLDLRGMQGNAKVLFCLSENSESPELQGQPSSPAGNMTAQSLATSNPGSGNNQLLRSLPTLSLVETSYVKYLEDELVRLKHESAEQDKKQKKTKEELSKAKIMAKEESLAKEKLTSEIRSLMQKNNLFDQLMLELSGNFFARDAQITQQLVTTSNHLDQYWLTVRQLQGRIAYMEGGVQAVLEESIQARENEDWRTSQPGPSGLGKRPAADDSKEDEGQEKKKKVNDEGSEDKN